MMNEDNNVVGKFENGIELHCSLSADGMMTKVSAELNRNRNRKSGYFRLPLVVECYLRDGLAVGFNTDRNKRLSCEPRILD